MLKRTETRPLILTGDDDSGCRGALTRLFRHSGFDVVTAGSLAQVRKRLSEYKPDALVMEYAFPDGRSVTILGNIRHDFPFIAIIMLTGAADVEAAADVLGKGLVDRFLTKPWDDDWLVDILKGVLREKVLLRRNRELVVKLQGANAHLEEKVRQRTLQLERAKQEWEMTFDAIDEPLFILETGNMTIQRANLATAELAGQNIQALVGQTCYQLFMGRDCACDLCPAKTGKHSRNRLSVAGRTFDAVFFKAGEDTYIVHLRARDA